MAKKLTPNGADGPATPKHNVADRRKLIQECAEQIVAIKAKRQELNEQAGEVRKRLKDAGVQTAAFDYAVRLQAMEGEARDSYMDTLRESFGALGIGEQHDLFAAMDEEGEADDRAPLSVANQAGLDAGLNSKLRSDNPHKKGTEPHEYWDRGWLAGQKQIAVAMKTGGGPKAPAPEPQPAA